MEVLSPRQIDFLKHYLDPKSQTYSNALQSGIKAGFSQEYSESITAQMPKWLSESLGDKRRLNKAEKRLEQILDLEPVDEDGKIDNSLIANQMKAITLVAKGPGKERYSERTEMTGANGKDLPTPILQNVFSNDRIEEDSQSQEEN